MYYIWKILSAFRKSLCGVSYAVGLGQTVALGSAGWTEAAADSVKVNLLFSSQFWSQL